MTGHIIPCPNCGRNMKSNSGYPTCSICRKTDGARKYNFTWCRSLKNKGQRTERRCNICHGPIGITPTGYDPDGVRYCCSCRNRRLSGAVVEDKCTLLGTKRPHHFSFKVGYGE